MSVPTSSSSTSSPIPRTDMHQALEELRKRFPTINTEISAAGAIIVSYEPRSSNQTSNSSGRGRGTKRGKRVISKSQSAASFEKTINRLTREVGGTRQDFGNQIIISTHSEQNDFLARAKEMAFDELPQELVQQIHKLPSPYQSMTLAKFLTFHAFKIIQKICHGIEDPTLSEGRFQSYIQMITFITHCQKVEFTNEDLKIINLFIDDTRVEEESVGLFLQEIRTYMTALVHRKTSLSKRQKETWGIPFHMFKVEFITALIDSRSAAQIRQEAYLYACLVPTMLEDVKRLLDTLSNNELFDKSKSLFNNFMNLVQGKTVNSRVNTDKLNAFIDSRSPDDPLIQEYHNRKVDYINHGEHLFNQATAISLELRMALLELLEIVPLPEFDGAQFFQKVGYNFSLSIEQLQAVFAVDISPYTEVFSQSRGQRLHQNMEETQMREFIENGVEEFNKLEEGIKHLQSEVDQALKMLNRYNSLLEYFPLWFWSLAQEGPLDTQLSEFLNFIHILCDHNLYDKIYNDAVKGFIKDHPTLFPEYTKFKKHNRQLLEIFCSLNYHLAHISLLGHDLKQVLEDYDKQGSLEKTRQEKKQTALKAIETHRQALEKQLMQESMIPRRRKQTRGNSHRRSKKAITIKSSSAIPPSSTSSPQQSIEVGAPSSSTMSTFEPISPVENLLNRFHDGFKAIQKQNLFAQQSWRNAIGIFNDLRIELIEKPNVDNASEVAEHTTRLVTLISLWIEQIISSHYLEEKNPQTAYDRWKLLRHDVKEIFEKCHLQQNEALRILINEVGNLETFSRTIYTSPHRSGRGADLLYRAERLHAEGNLNPDLNNALLTDSYRLITEAMGCIQQVMPMPSVSLDPLIEILIGSPSTVDHDIENRKLYYTIEDTLTKLQPFISEVSLDKADPSDPNCHLADARRLLRLVQTRLRRGNVGNMIKTLSNINLAIESLSIAKCIQMGQSDVDVLDRANLTHNLMEWCEILGYHHPSREEDEFLLRSGKMLNFTRYSQFYDPRQLSPIHRTLLRNVNYLNKHAMTVSGNWKVVGHEAKISAVLSQERQHALVGLTIFSKLAYSHDIKHEREEKNKIKESYV